jgi:hypothetical protein
VGEEIGVFEFACSLDQRGVKAEKGRGAPPEVKYDKEDLPLLNSEWGGGPRRLVKSARCFRIVLILNSGSAPSKSGLPANSSHTY